MKKAVPLSSEPPNAQKFPAQIHTTRPTLFSRLARSKTKTVIVYIRLRQSWPEPAIALGHHRHKNFHPSSSWKQVLPPQFGCSSHWARKNSCLERIICRRTFSTNFVTLYAPLFLLAMEIWGVAGCESRSKVASSNLFLIRPELLPLKYSSTVYAWVKLWACSRHKWKKVSFASPQNIFAAQFNGPLILGIRYCTLISNSQSIIAAHTLGVSTFALLSHPSHSSP